MNPDITFVRSVVTPADFPRTGLPEIAVAGRSNVGKSSLINRLFGRKNIARVSRQPGKTRALNYFLVNEAFYFVDLPGYGYAKVSKKERDAFAALIAPYLANRQVLRGLIILMDARHGPVSGDHAMLEWVRAWEGSLLFVFTKADKLSGNQRTKAMREFKETIGAENMVMFSALTGRGAGSVWSWIESVLGVPLV